MDAGYVIKGLEESIAFFRDRVTGNMYDKWLHASEDALALLKAQEPRLITDTELEEIRKVPLILKPNVDAVPVEWMRDKMRGYASALKSTELKALVTVMQMWQKEQEAR